MRRSAHARARDVAELEQLRGEVTSTRVVGGDFWGIAEVRPDDGAAAVTVVGKLLGVQPGDAVEVRGSWTEHPKFGRQFKAREIKTRVPSNASGIVAWLCSRLPGIGRARATALVEAFGADRVWHVIEHEPDRLLEVKGITLARRDEIKLAYELHRGERDRMVRLRGWGLTDAQIARAIVEWGEGVEDVLRENPYRLAEDVRGFGFARADEVALRMGLPASSPARVRAGLLHLLEEAATHGHVYVPRPKVITAAVKLLGLDAQLIGRELARVIESGVVVEREGRVYLPQLDGAEGRVAGAVRALNVRQANG